MIPLNAISQIEWYGIEEEVTFLHTTLQEFLAAVHLTTLDNEKQVSIIEEIVRSRSWYQKSVLQFYVGLVGLNITAKSLILFWKVVVLQFTRTWLIPCC